MAGSHFSGPVYSLGIPLIGAGGVIPVPGDVYWIHPASSSVSDGNAQSAGPDRPRATLSSVQSSMTSDQNDMVILIGNSSASAGNVISETANVAWTKSLTHIIGSAMNRVAHRVSLRNSGTDPTKLMDNSASGCVFANFQVSLAQATAETQIGWDESGGRNAYYNIHMGLANSTARQQAGSRDLLITGEGEHYFSDCTIGFDTADSKNMSNIQLAGQTARNIFERCNIVMHATDATPNLMEIGTSGIARWTLFRDCSFINDSSFGGGTELTEAFEIAADCGGIIIMQSTYVYGTALVETASASTVLHGGGGIGTTASILGVANAG